MRVRVFATPNAKKASVTKISSNELEVKIDAIPEGDQANRRLVEILSEYFDVPRSSISIMQGHKSRVKILQIRNKTV